MKTVTELIIYSPVGGLVTYDLYLLLILLGLVR